MSEDNKEKGNRDLMRGERHEFSWRERGRSFRYAFAGLKALMIEEHNAWIHLSAAVMAVALGLVFGLEAVEWCIIIICIAMVFALEAVNTAVESLADRISREQSALLKVAKDVAAGAVLVAAIGSLIVGCIIFVPKLITALS